MIHITNIYTFSRHFSLLLFIHFNNEGRIYLSKLQIGEYLSIDILSIFRCFQ